jgi:DNA invertase Pin-like site-specific DNA recombinase
MELTELRQYAARSGWEVVEYLENESSVKARPVFQQLMQDAQFRKFDIVIVWKIGRFARSMKQLIESVLELDRLRIRFFAFTQGIDTDGQTLGGRFVIHFFAAVAQLDRLVIGERTKAGIAAARRRGRQCGRPRKIFRRD